VKTIHFDAMAFDSGWAHPLLRVNCSASIELYNNSLKLFAPEGTPQSVLRIDLHEYSTSLVATTNSTSTLASSQIAASSNLHATCPLFFVVPENPDAAIAAVVPDDVRAFGDFH
jgi:hypothetical protein